MPIAILGDSVKTVPLYTGLNLPFEFQNFGSLLATIFPSLSLSLSNLSFHSFSIAIVHGGEESVGHPRILQENGSPPPSPVSYSHHNLSPFFFLSSLTPSTSKL